MGDKHFGLELPQILVFAWLLVLYTLLTPLLLFSVNRYRRALHHPFIYCRRPKLVITCCILTILYSSIYAPVLLIIAQFTQYNSLSLPAHFLLNALPLLLISLHFSIRFYQVYYDLNYNSSMADQIWSQAINANQHNFYIKNRTFYGKPRFQYIVFTVFMSVTFLLITAIVLIFGADTIYIAQILIVFVLIAHIIPLIIIFKKLNSFLDNIKLRTELLWNVILSLLSIAVITIHCFLYIFCDKSYTKSIQIHGYTIISVIISVIYFCICYIQTLFIILQPEAQSLDIRNRNNKSLSTNSNHKYSVTSYSPGTPYEHGGTPSFPVSTPEIASAMSLHSVNSRSFHASQISTDKSHTPKHTRTRSLYSNNVRINHVFGNDISFKLFIRHLAKEYCIENALFLFESQQFKKQCMDIESQLCMITNNTNAQSNSTAQMPAQLPIPNNNSANSKRGGVYSKQRKNVMLSVPTTVHEQESDKDMDSPHSEDLGKNSPNSVHSPVSISGEDKYDEIMSNITVPQTVKLSHHLSAQSNHYDDTTKILDFIPFHLIPQSQIIEKYDNDFEKIFIKLYDKYIDWKSSSFEVNISGGHRSKLHSIYVRITYQLLMEERKILLIEQEKEKRKSNVLNVDNGFVVDESKPRATQMWQSRKTIVNALKATITKTQMSDSSGEQKSESDMERRVEIKEVIEALTLAETDIMKNLNDSLRRFKGTVEFQNWISENMNAVPVTP